MPASQAGRRGFESRLPFVEINQLRPGKLIPTKFKRGDGGDLAEAACRNASLRTRPVTPVVGKRSGTVAVGTAIADRPPHRSVRAELPHTATT